MTQAQLFHQFMVNQWDNGTNRDWDNAATIASVLGARPTGDLDEDDMAEWLFPDGSTARIARNGNGCTI